jgi:hypothetical protein
VTHKKQLQKRHKGAMAFSFFFPCTAVMLLRIRPFHRACTNKKVAELRCEDDLFYALSLTSTAIFIAPNHIGAAKLVAPRALALQVL